MGSALLRGGCVLTVDSADRVLEDGFVAVRDGRIADVGPAALSPDPSDYDEVFDLTGHLVMPETRQRAYPFGDDPVPRPRRGQSLLTMEGWYNAIREPELSLEADDIGPPSRSRPPRCCSPARRLFCDQYFFAEEIAAAVAESGIRAVIAYGIVQLGDEARGTEELAKATAFIERQRSADGRIVPWFGPHAPYVDNTEALLRAEVAVAREHGVGLHLHMAAGPEDNEETLARYGLTATQALERDGFFEGRVHAAHCLDLSDADIAIFARAPAASVAWCATAGLRSGKPGICPAVALREAGVTVALGTDNVAANNAYDMVAEMRVAGLVASHREGRAQPIPSTALLRMATIEGARALGLDREVGSLEVGKAADIAAIDISGPGYSETPDPATLLVYSGSGRDVRHVWVAGEQLVRDRALVRRPLADIRRDYGRAYRTFWDRVAAARSTSKRDVA